MKLQRYFKEKGLEIGDVKETDKRICVDINT